MTTFHMITAGTYWLLIIMWTCILFFYVHRIRKQRLKNALFTTLIVVLAIDAFRTLVESIYFGIWYTALAGLLPTPLQEFLEKPEIVIIPKFFNVVVAAIIILILLRRWLPEEELELHAQKTREHNLQEKVAARTRALKDTNEQLRREIVEHAEAVTALRKSEQQLARTEAFSLVMTTHVGLDGRWLKVPPTLCNLLGYTAAELLSQKFQDVTHPEDFEKYWSQCQRLIRGEIQSFELEKRYIHRDGTIIWIYLNCSTVKDADGTPIHFLTYIKDITDRKRIEDERQRLTAELRHAQKMEAVGRLAGGVAHDFNNRLMTILGNAEILITRLESPRGEGDRELLRACAKEIRQAGERGAELIKQLLTFGRKQLTKPQALDTRRVLADTERMLKTLVREDIRLEFKTEPTPAPIFGDAGQVEQVLINLVLNARDSLGQAGHITVACTTVDISREQAAAHPGSGAGPHVLISVTDNGTGMTDEVVQHIFEPFFTTKPIGKGTGLGLATVHGIVSHMRGFVTVKSRQGIGTTFNVYLPIAKEGYHQACESNEVSYQGNGEVVLVCEDDHSVRSVTAKILTAAGYTVLEAADGEQACKIAHGRVEPIDLLVTDLVMPGIAGQELAKRLTSDVPDLRVLFVSGYAPDAVDLDVSDHRQAFLTKPFRSADLLGMIHSVLHGPDPAHDRT